MCGWTVYLLTPHPTEPTRAFRTAGCHAGRNLNADLQESRNTGATWSKLLSPPFAFPQTIVGGSGADPNRLFLALDNDYRSGGSKLLTSPDDGATWTTVLEHKGGGTATGSKDASITIGGLAYNSLLPSSVYLGLNSNPYPFKGVDSATVSASSDGGQTWNTLGQGPLSKIEDLALGIDGLNLYAATRTGLMRLALG